MVALEIALVAAFVVIEELLARLVEHGRVRPPLGLALWLALAG